MSAQQMHSNSRLRLILDLASSMSFVDVVIVIKPNTPAMSFVCWLFARGHTAGKPKWTMCR